jgi:hypothetical protein
MFGLSATLAPKLNGIQVGFPYVMQFMMERNAARLAQQAAVPAKPEPAKVDKPEKADKADTKDEVLLN